MNFLMLLISFLCAITNCLALVTGAPATACSSLLPVHSGINPQQGNAPYTVSVDKISGNKIRVTISPTSGDEFQGFILQARSSIDKRKFIAGEFKSGEVSKAINCFNQRQSTLTHASPQSKTRVITEWTATSNVNEDIIFRATVAKSYVVFWKDIDSKPVGITNEEGQSVSSQRDPIALPIYDDCSKSKGCFGLSSKLASGAAVEFTTVEVSVGATDSVKIHGTFMVTGWVGFVSIAILLARHYKNVWENSTLGGVKIWYALHRAFMITALVFIIIAFIVIFFHKIGWNFQASNPHANLGCIAICLGLLNTVVALFRPALGHPMRAIFNWLHPILGNVAQIISIITIFFAVSLPSSGLKDDFYWVMGAFVIVHLIFHVLYQTHEWIQGKKKNNELIMNEMNETRANSAHNGGYNSQIQKVKADEFRILLLCIYSIFLILILVTLYILIGVA